MHTRHLARTRFNTTKRNRTLMASPEGSLTSGQFEIMQLLWESKDGLTVVEIWETIGVDRDVSRHYGLVFGTCLRITRNPQDAEELTQECFFDLVRHASHIRTSLAGWLHQVATNLAINRLRDERPGSEIEPLVDQALMEIPEHLRTPILMHYLEGVTHVVCIRPCP